MELTSNGDFDGYIQKLDSDGNFLWVKQIGGPGDDKPRQVTTDINGDVYITGKFEETVDFDPGLETMNFTSNGDIDIFILKLDADGNLVWAKQMGGIYEDEGMSITTNASGNVITTGYFSYTVDFDPGNGTTDLTSNGYRDIFIQQLNSSGDLVWAKQIGGPSNWDIPERVIVGPDGELLVLGTFEETVDFDPGEGITNFTSNGFDDMFILKLGEIEVDIIENTFKENIQVYPNPSKGPFTIDLGKEYNDVTVQITNILGQVISTQKYAYVKNIETRISGNAGIYFVKVSTKKGGSNILRIIKN